MLYYQFNRQLYKLTEWSKMDQDVADGVYPAKYEHLQITNKNKRSIIDAHDHWLYIIYIWPCYTKSYHC